MRIQRYIIGLLESNGYILSQRKGGDCYIVDPGGKPEKFLEYIRKEDLKCLGILLTHHHHDHVGGVEKIHRTLACPVYLHRLDLDIYKKEALALEDKDRFDLEGESIQVIHTPGHTQGGVCFFSEKSKAAFTGDTLFNVDLGRTDLKDGDPWQMEQTIRNIIDLWSNDITIYPGHGDACTMKTVRSINREYLDLVTGT